MTSFLLDATTAIAADRRRRLLDQGARDREVRAGRRSRLLARARGAPSTGHFRVLTVDLRALRSH